MSHTRERPRAMQSGGVESGKEALHRLAALPLDCVIAATLLTIMLQREPARRLLVYAMPLQNQKKLNTLGTTMRESFIQLPWTVIRLQLRKCHACIAKFVLAL